MLWDNPSTETWAPGTAANEEVADANGAQDVPQGSGDADKCFSCGETGAAECPTPREMTCRYCHQPGHMVKDCPDKPAMVCSNCGQEGHMRNSCTNARKLDRDNVATVNPDEAWAKIKTAASERDVDDVKEAVQEYVKALDGAVTYRELQEGLINEGINLFLVAVERPLAPVFTNMDLQGNMGKKYSISYRFTEKPGRPREADAFPKNREELLARLDDAGPKPRVDKSACRNCGQSGHRAADCEEPPNLDNVECRKCGETGHFSRDCPQGGPRGCRNCGGEGHMAKDCDQPRNMDLVTCRNCDKTGHMSRECPEPRDWSKVQCSNCQKYGHTKVRCQEPPAESDAFQAGGFDAGQDHTSGPADDSWGNAGSAAVATADSGGWGRAKHEAVAAAGSWIEDIPDDGRRFNIK
ncbi:hypothetical protein CDD80_2534 [Ophiocordyceps camponoti-rufipedis]|uniref:Uncharacterized protein n=1 Tax=Ophiocordyceps camponoti-rufipedis TaxID=2004952 RepID=A0A2C5YAY0_9HYPO|nr:hypothetical protein CDD80_2534 [Ophiocordyceps camponoti-rufipedis]